MRHYYHVIVNAQKEILFATMYWEKSQSSNMISKAFRDLNKRAASENRRVIIKLMMDHPTVSNAIYFHYIIPSNKWSYYGIPSPEEIPNISLEVHNYHHIIMGTFHSKFLIVDRKLALLNSNNIQDRPNLEMMSHFQGDIVNSFYDAFLISWWIPFQPNVVCLNDNTSKEQDFHFNPQVNEEEICLHEKSNEDIQTINYNRSVHLPNFLVKIIKNITRTRIDHHINTKLQSSLTKHLNKSSRSAHYTKTDKNISAEEMEVLSLEFNPFIFHRPHEPFPIALVSRLPCGTPGYKDTMNPQDAVWLGAFEYAQKSIFIQSPTLNASPAIDGIIAACQRGIKVTLWLGLGFNNLREGHGTFQGGTNEHVVKKLYKELTKTGNGIERNLEIFWYTAKG